MPYELLQFGFSFLLLTALAWLFVEGLRYWAQKKRILDIPNERSSHSRPTPRGGGIAIVVICLAAWFGYAWKSEAGFSAIVWGYGAAAALVAAVSWWDDIRHLSSALRFAVHALAAIIVFWTCGWCAAVSLPGGGEMSLCWLGIPLSFLWMVGLTNAFNFMDGIDGIAGGQAIVAGIGWMLLGKILGEPAVIVLGMAIAASSLGFLFHNWPPAKIFMGDVGSAFLGFTFAFLTVWCSLKSTRLAALSVLFVWPFAFDSIFTFFRRLSKRENVFAAHRSHLYQRLVQTGLTHAQVSGLYIVLAGIGLLPLLTDDAGMKTAPRLIVVGIIGLCGGLWVLTARREKTACAP